MKGIYILLLELIKKSSITIGKLGEIEFKIGNYIYIGSAQNGLEARINRHLRKHKKIFWHIDYLLQIAQIKNVYYNQSKKTEECALARLFSKELEEIKGFGASDCRCTSHLFFENKDIDFKVMIEKLGLKEYEKESIIHLHA